MREIVIEIVLMTDLSKHFDFVGKLKELAARKGHAAWAGGKRVSLSGDVLP